MVTVTCHLILDTSYHIYNRKSDQDREDTMADPPDKGGDIIEDKLESCISMRYT
jgi:hypothetical protein